MIALVGNQSSAPNANAKLSYQDLSGLRTINATFEIVANQTGPYCNEWQDVDLTRNVYGYGRDRKCGLFDLTVYRGYELGLTNWLMSLGDAIALADTDVYILQETIVLCAEIADTFRDDDQGLQYGDTMDDGIDPCQFPDSYQQMTITVQAGGVYEGGKIMESFKNISIYEDSMKYVNRFICNCLFLSVWDDEWLQTCQPCAVTQTYCTAVNMRGELYCPPGQQPTKQADGTYGCQLCDVDFYSIYKSLDECIACPAGSVCDREGTVIPFSQPGYWRKNPWSIQPLFYEPYQRKYEFSFKSAGPGTPKASSGYYTFHKCKNDEVCRGGKNSTCGDGHWAGTPICGVCMLNHYEMMGGCIECGPSENVEMMLMVIMVMAMIAMTIFTAWFLAVDLRSDISEEKEESKDESASASRATKLKMLLSYTQVFGSNEGTFEIPWPKEFLDMMDSVKSVMEFNPVDMPVLNIKCVSTSNFYSKYYVMVLAPPGLMSYFSLCALYGGSYLRGQGAKIGVLPWVLRRKMAIFNDNAWQLSFWMLLIIYPQVSKIVLQLLNCKKFDIFSEEYDDEGNPKNVFYEKYLDIDLSIDCNSLEYLFHEIFLGWPTFILYPVGVPVFFFALLQQARKSVAWTKRLSFMFTTYKEAYWWFGESHVRMQYVCVYACMHACVHACTRVRVHPCMRVCVSSPRPAPPSPALSCPSPDRTSPALNHTPPAPL